MRNKKHTLIALAVLASWTISIARLVVTFHSPVIEGPSVSLYDFNLHYVFAFLFL